MRGFARVAYVGSLTFCAACGGSSDNTAGVGPARCAQGQDSCDGVCVNRASDPSNCGTCGTRCGTGQTCTSGACVAAPKPPDVVTATCTAVFAENSTCTVSTGRTYYVSAAGSDTGDGLSEATPIQTLTQASNLVLAAGDKVLFKCGDIWRGETLRIHQSGTDCRHIVFGSYPAACANQPRISGSQPISGWTRTAGGTWTANLRSGDNQGKFPNGINQLLRGDERLPLGRWPNIDDTGLEIGHGYSHIDAQPTPTTFVDASLPAIDWTGASIHYFTIRWKLLNRRVTSSSSKQLVLNAATACQDGNCGNPQPGSASAYGFGYFLNNHPGTLDQQDEWYYDARTGDVLLVSGAEPTGIEGSAVPTMSSPVPAAPSNDDGADALVMLGLNAQSPIHHVVVENLRIENGWRNGIGTPINQLTNENSDLVLRCNTIRNIDSKVINLATWVLDPIQHWRGGTNLVVSNNVIDGANHFGIQSYAQVSTFEGNTISNIGLLEKLGESGLGCSLEDEGCTENGDAILLRTDIVADTSHDLSIRRNRIKRTAYCGLDTFGTRLNFEQNVITEACFTKSDCGAIRTYLGTDITIKENLILDVPGPTWGSNSTYSANFGMGLYIDAGSIVRSEGNTIRGATNSGILHQGATDSGRNTDGTVIGNTVFGVHGNNMVYVGWKGKVTAFTDNILVCTEPLWSIFTEAHAVFQNSDRNVFFQPYREKNINIEYPVDTYSQRDLATWQSVSGMDKASTSAWFTLAADTPAPMELFVNDTDVAKDFVLTKNYVDLDRNPVNGTLTLAPFKSKVLVAQ
jgi:hypothetical protein